MDHAIITIDKTAAEPIVQQISDNITKEIFNSRLSPGDKLPTERELAQALAVSRGTVKRAYARLEQARMIKIRPGSGSYVLANGQILESNKKKEAAEIVATTITRLQSMGLSDKEIFNLVNLRLSTSQGIRKMSIMVFSNNLEILSELEQQLSYLTSSLPSFFTLSFLTLENIKNNPDPIQTLINYDIIIATSIDFKETINLVPPLRQRIIEATITPYTSTINELSDLPRDSKINIIYRTRVFSNMVAETLKMMGFVYKNLFFYQESEYKPSFHFENEVKAVINFNESPVYINPDYKEANKKFMEEGKKLIYFRYRIDRKSLLYIEERIQNLFHQ